MFESFRQPAAKHAWKRGRPVRPRLGPPRAASPSAPLESSPSGSLFHFCKCRAFRAMALVATVQPTAATHEYASFINKKVADQADGIWTTGTVQCLHEGILPPMTRIQHVLPANSIFPNKSQPFSIVWADDTDLDLSSSLLADLLGQP